MVTRLVSWPRSSRALAVWSESTTTCRQHQHSAAHTRRTDAAPTQTWHATRVRACTYYDGKKPSRLHACTSTDSCPHLVQPASCCDLQCCGCRWVLHAHQLGYHALHTAVVPATLGVSVTTQCTKRTQRSGNPPAAVRLHVPTVTRDNHSWAVAQRCINDVCMHVAVSPALHVGSPVGEVQR